jgi:hypothetical protein
MDNSFSIASIDSEQRTVMKRFNRQGSAPRQISVFINGRQFATSITAIVTRKKLDNKE